MQVLKFDVDSIVIGKLKLTRVLRRPENNPLRRAKDGRDRTSPCPTCPPHSFLRGRCENKEVPRQFKGHFPFSHYWRRPTFYRDSVNGFEPSLLPEQLSAIRRLRVLGRRQSSYGYSYFKKIGSWLNQVPQCPTRLNRFVMSIQINLWILKHSRKLVEAS